MFQNLHPQLVTGGCQLRVRLGTGSTPGSNIINSGYVSAGKRDTGFSGQSATNNDGFLVASPVQNLRGHMIITKFDDTTYIESHQCMDSTDVIFVGAGELTGVSAPITQIAIVTEAGSTDPDFQSGKVNVLYEG